MRKFKLANSNPTLQTCTIQTCTIQTWYNSNSAKSNPNPNPNLTLSEFELCKFELLSVNFRTPLLRTFIAS